jgi:hypothetical protein
MISSLSSRSYFPQRAYLWLAWQPHVPPLHQEAQKLGDLQKQCDEQAKDRVNAKQYNR